MLQRLMKKASISIMVAVMMMGGTMTAQAAGWQRNEHGWWYGTNADNSTWYANGWQWIDGNGDNIAECYYFDENGYMLANRDTPDGYIVNADGAWAIGGTVQTKVVDTAKVADGTYDVRDYDSQGISKAAIDILLHTREENAKYGEVKADVIGPTCQVYYANGLMADYSYTHDGCPGRIRADGDSTLIFKESVKQSEKDAEALKAKGYNVTYGASMWISDIWDGRMNISIAGLERGAQYNWLSFYSYADTSGWGTAWGY